VAPILSLSAGVLPQPITGLTSDTIAAELTGSSNRTSSPVFLTPSAPGQAGGQVSGTASAPFSDLLTEAVGQVDLLERQARDTIEGLMTGKGVDVHQAMIATEKAEMGFELMLSVRNKALSAYQQIIGMQF